MRKDKKSSPEADVEGNSIAKEDHLETSSDHVPSIKSAEKPYKKKPKVKQSDSGEFNLFSNYTVFDVISFISIFFWCNTDFYENTRHDIQIQDLAKVIEKLSKDDEKGFETELMVS